MRIAKLGFAASILAGTAAHAVPVTSHSPIVEKQVATSCKTIDREELNKTGRTSVSEVLQSLPPADSSLDEHGCAPPQPTDPVNQEALAAQNAERASMGLPLFTYSPELAQRAQAWANVLPSIGRPDHSPREGRADIHENISQGLGDWSVGRLQYNWFKEKRYLKPGIFPDVSTTGNWEDVGHISQIDWRLTTQIGCGLSRGGGFSYLVCDYSPGGNKDGKPVGIAMNNGSAGLTTVANTDGPSLPPVRPADIVVTNRPFRLDVNKDNGTWYDASKFGGVLDKPGLFFYDLAYSSPLRGVISVPNSSDFELAGLGDIRCSGPRGPVASSEAPAGHVMAAQFYDRSRFHLETMHVDNNNGGGILVDTLGGFYQYPEGSAQPPDLDTKVEAPNIGGLPEIFDPTAKPAADTSDCLM